MYSNHVHGWKVKDWRDRCIGKEHTLTLFRSQKGNVSAGYLHIKWEEGGSIGKYGKDSSAFVLSIDHKKKLIPSSTDANVTLFGINYGPHFGTHSLTVMAHE